MHQEHQFILTSTFFTSTQNTFHQTQKFSSLNSLWDKPTNFGLHFIYHLEFMKVNSFWIKTCFLVIQNEKFNLCIHAPNLRILDQNCSLAHEIHCLSCMTSISVLGSNHPTFSQNLVIISKTFLNSHFSFQIVSNTFKFWAISLWLFTYPSHSRMASIQKMIKWVLLIQIRIRWMF